MAGSSFLGLSAFCCNGTITPAFRRDSRVFCTDCLHSSLTPRQPSSETSTCRGFRALLVAVPELAFAEVAELASVRPYGEAALSSWRAMWVSHIPALNSNACFPSAGRGAVGIDTRVCVVSACACGRMYVCMHVCMCACKHACMHVCMYACMYVCVCMCNINVRVCMCMHVYVCIHTHMY